MDQLYSFVLMADEDELQTDPNLVHEPCGQIISRLEPGDELITHIRMAIDHNCAGME